MLKRDAMRTTEYRNQYKNVTSSRVWVIHNSDFSGKTYVGFSTQDDKPSFEWQLEDGRVLLDGNFLEAQMYMHGDESMPVPDWVIGRAVATAVRHHITYKVISHAEQL